MHFRKYSLLNQLLCYFLDMHKMDMQTIWICRSNTFRAQIDQAQSPALAWTWVREVTDQFLWLKAGMLARLWSLAG